VPVEVHTDEVRRNDAAVVSNRTATVADGELEDGAVMKRVVVNSQSRCGTARRDAKANRNQVGRLQTFDVGGELVVVPTSNTTSSAG